MNRFLVGSIVVFLIISLAAPSLFSKGEIEVMFNFYNGLADIVEKNQNDPDKCVAESEAYIRKNAGSLNEAARRAEAMEKSAITEEEAMRMMNDPYAMLPVPGANPLDRFTLIFEQFSQRYPQHADKIRQVVAEYEQEF